MKWLCILFLFSFSAYGQHDHPAAVKGDAHLNHIQACRQQIVYINNLPSPQLMKGIGEAGFMIQTSSDKTQKYFNQGVALLHCFWDLEAYRSFKEAIRNDTAAIMPYWGMLHTIGANRNEEFKKDKEQAIKKLKLLKTKATEHERLYAEGVLLIDSLKDNGYDAYTQKLELIAFKFPDDVDARLLLALQSMGGFDHEMNPNKGHIYSEYILRDILRTHPNNLGAHHYWIHQMENCCPEKAIESADKLASLGPSSGHIVHMPGHIYYKTGDYKRAYDAFVGAVKVDSAYMKRDGIDEVDNWNYIHNINYLLANCAEDGRYKSGLYYAEKLKNMHVAKERKKIYEGTFFYQGILAPAKMELRYGYWDKAVQRLDEIQDTDSVYGKKQMSYKVALSYFASGMSALEKNKIDDARKYANLLDAYLWRNANQGKKPDVLGKYIQRNMNAASLELQGCIKSQELKHDEAIALLEAAMKEEKELGYSEPPSYARPVLISLAAAYTRAGKSEKAIESYESLLKRHPNSQNAYWGLINIYKMKGDAVKANEYNAKLAEASKYADKNLFKEANAEINGKKKSK